MIDLEFPQHTKVCGGWFYLSHGDLLGQSPLKPPLIPVIPLFQTVLDRVQRGRKTFPNPCNDPRPRVLSFLPSLVVGHRLGGTAHQNHDTKRKLGIHRCLLSNARPDLSRSDPAGRSDDRCQNRQALGPAILEDFLPVPHRDTHEDHLEVVLGLELLYDPTIVVVENAVQTTLDIFAHTVPFQRGDKT